MANYAVKAQTGRTVYLIVRNASFQPFNGSVFANWVDGNYSTYALAMAEQGTSGLYTITFPSVAAGNYIVEAHYQAGGTPVIDATVDTVIGSEVVFYDGISNPYGIAVSITSGSGIYSVNQNGGTGSAGALITVNGVNSSTDCLRYVGFGNIGISGVTIRAYLKSDFDNNVKNVLATQVTGSDGRWLGPIFLNSGSYYLITDLPGNDFNSNQVALIIP